MTKLIGLTPKLTPDQIDVIDLLKETLAQALEGKVTSVGIIACMEKGYAHVMAGRQAADLNMGCDSLKREILSAVELAGAKMAGAGVTDIVERLHVWRSHKRVAAMPPEILDPVIGEAIAEIEKLRATITNMEREQRVKELVSCSCEGP